MKHLFAFALLSLFVTVACAQNAELPPSRGLFFHSSAGIGIPNSYYKSRIKNGFVPETGVELRLGSHSALAADLSFAAYKYNQSGTFYNLESRLKITSLTLFYKHLFGNGRWRPYLRAGGGGSMVAVPTVILRGALVDIRNEKQTIAQAQGEAGLQFAASRRYSLFIGAAHQRIFGADLLGPEDLSVTSIKVGLVTKF